MDVKTAYAKACRYCAYQERTQAQVRDKLKEWQLWDDAIDELIIQLSKEGFINEERFAKAFVLGKFKQLKWGRIKIKYELQKHALSDYCIKKGLQEIDADEYIHTLQKLALQKWRSYTEKSTLIKKLKVKKFLVSKGFEADLAEDVLQTIEK